MPQDRKEGDKLVVTDNPEYSERANRLMAEELREAVGAPEVERRAAAPGEAAHHRHSEAATTLWNNRPLLGIVTALLILLGAVAALSTESWFVVAGAIVLVIVLWTVYLVGIGGTMSEHEGPDPGRAAAMEEEGVLDPEGELNERVSAIDSAHGEATRGQTESWTPASGSNPDITDRESYDAAQDTPAARARRRLGEDEPLR